MCENAEAQRNLVFYVLFSTTDSLPYILNIRNIPGLDEAGHITCLKAVDETGYHF